MVLVSLSRLRSNRYAFGLLLAVIATCLYSLKGIIVKIMYKNGIDSISVMALRMFFILPIYILIGIRVYAKLTFKQAQSIKSNWYLCCLIGVVGYYLSSFFDLKSLNYLSAQLSGLLSFTYPIFVCFINWFLFKETFKKDMWLTLFLSYSGIILLLSYEFNFGDTSGVLFGAVYAVGGALAFACYMVFSKRFMSKIPSTMFTSIAMGAASVCVFIHFLTEEGWKDINLTLQVLLLSLTIAIVCTIAPSFLLSEAINCIGTNQVAVMGAFGPAATALMAVFILSEPFSSYHFWGMALVVLSAIWSFLMKFIKTKLHYTRD
ncbi:DMT family transporter [Xenorhabdus japonica]|uniref:EamA-like transporter family protein n=1 Tax=Xenorhabdus japonica TaxID=53341 RepID=A0A1I5CWR8_9GAMM|nr:DMT family transporter [Xenorhabdus japonica]SFN91450.1 EamA-like transporter family protein [Xenorhabdus japonica]